MNSRAQILTRSSWACFEWARNPYVLLITLYIYAPYFARDIVGDPVKGQAMWGAIAGNAGLAVAAAAPFLGAIADAGGRRKPWVFLCVVLLGVCSALLWFAEPGGKGIPLLATAILIALANVAYDFSLVFHGAMLPLLTPPSRVGRLSGAGYALGNVAGLLLLIFALVFLYLPEVPAFGLSKAAHEHERIAGPLCAMWLALFCIPFFLWTPDRPASSLSFAAAARAGFSGVVRTVKSLRHYRNVGKYLIARALYNDGKTAMLTFGGVYASGVFHWQAAELAVYGIILSVFAAIGGAAGGRLADAIGAKPALIISIAGTAIGGLLSLSMAPDRIFFFVRYAPGAGLGLPIFNTLPELLYLLMVILVAMCIVAAYANSRTMLAKIAPEGRMTEFFGLYALSGEATAFMAPLAVAFATTLSGSQQWGMVAIIAFLLAGLFVLLFVKEERAEEI